MTINEIKMIKSLSDELDNLERQKNSVVDSLQKNFKTFNWNESLLNELKSTVENWTKKREKELTSDLDQYELKKKKEPKEIKIVVPEIPESLKPEKMEQTDKEISKIIKVKPESEPEKTEKK